MTPPITTTDAADAAIVAAEAAQDSHKLNMTPAQARVVLERTAGTLAAAHGIVVEFQEGACPQTDGKKIIIPPPNVTSWEEWLQVRGYIDHETSHILFTDMKEFEGLNDFQGLCLNALEDVRVNTLMRERFPGSIENLGGMYRRTIRDALKRKTDDPAQAAKMPLHIQKLGALQIQTENLQAMGAPEDLFGAAGVPFAKQHADRFRGEIDRAQTTNDLRQAAIDLAALIDPEKAAQPPRPQSGKGQAGKGGPKDKNHASDPGNANGNPQAGDQGNQGESDQPGASPLDQASKQALGEIGGGASTYANIRASGGQRSNAQYEQACARSHVASVPTFVPYADKTARRNGRGGMGDATVAAWAAQLTDAMRMGAGVRDNLRQALRARTMVRKTRDQEAGNLDMGKLAVIAARVKDPAVYCKTSPGIAVNTACHVLVDASGSMCDALKWPACPAAAAIFADAAIGCGAVARVTTYDDPDTGREFCAFGEKPTRAEWVNRMKMAAPIGGTPTGNHVQAAARDLLKRPEARKILVVCTDGQPDSPEYCAQMTGVARAAGVEVYTIAIGMPQDYATRYLGAGAVGCPSMADLRGVLLRILTRCLLRQEGKGVGK